MTELFIIRAVQQKSPEKPHRENGGKFLKKNPNFKTHGKHEYRTQLQCFP